MKTYYTQEQAQHYNQRRRSLSEKILAATISLLHIHSHFRRNDYDYHR